MSDKVEAQFTYWYSEIHGDWSLSVDLYQSGLAVSSKTWHAPNRDHLHFLGCAFWAATIARLVMEENPLLDEQQLFLPGFDAIPDERPF
jgi:hypothetical protein